MHRFFNAGHKIDELYSFSLPEGADAHVIGKWPFVAPRESWFEVPRELNVGVATIAVQFHKDIQRKYGKRGVVLLDPTHDPKTEDPDKPLEFFAVAPTEELVIQRAEKLWDEYLEGICKAHFEDVQNAMAAGGAPRAARGFTVHALKLKGYRDSAQDFFLGMKEGHNGKAAAGMSAEVLGMMQAMQQQSQAMMAVVMALATGQKIDPELLKAVVAPPTNGKPAAPPIEPPDNAGDFHVEGQGLTSLEQRISRKTVEYETLKDKPADKKGRAAAAAKEL